MAESLGIMEVGSSNDMGAPNAHLGDHAPEPTEADRISPGKRRCSYPPSANVAGDPAGCVIRQPISGRLVTTRHLRASHVMLIEIEED